MREWFRRTIFIARQTAWRQARICLALNLVVPIARLFGISAVVPFIFVVVNPDRIQEVRLLRLAYETFAFNDTHQFLLALGAATILLLSVSNLFCLLVEQFNRRFALTVHQQTSSRILLGALAQNYESFVQQSHSEVRQNIVSQSLAVANTWVVGLMRMCGDVLTIGIIVAALLFIDFQASLIAAVFLAGFFGGVYSLVRNRLRLLGAQNIACNRSIDDLIATCQKGFKEIRLMSAEQTFAGQLRRILQGQGAIQARQSLMQMLPNSLVELVIFSTAVALTMYFLVTSSDADHVIPIIGMYATAAIRLLPALRSTFVGLTACRFHLTHLRKISNALAEAVALPPPAAADSRTSHATVIQHEVSLTNISYRYPGTETAALHQVSCTFPVGQIVGIAGASGCGKSTLLNILTGFLQPASGSVAVDGQDISPQHMSEWQAGIGYVSQDGFVFPDTIAANIAFGSKTPDQDRVRKVAQIALVDRFTDKKPQGLATRLDDAGLSLSGGQRQRIAIARALYRNPQILILDEATSALDPETEHALIANLAACAEIKVIIIVTHRQSSLDLCDQVFRLSEPQPVPYVSAATASVLSRTVGTTGVTV